MLALLLGIPLGVLASLGAWWLLFHVAIPSIRFAQHVHTVSRPPSLEKFTVEMTNIGRRAIIDCTVIAELQVVGMNPSFPKNIWNIRLPLRNSHITYWDPRTVQHAVILPYEPSPAVAPYLVARESKTLSLGTLLTTHAKASLRIVVFGHDSFSGSRKAFVSKRYTAADVTPFEPSSKRTQPDDQEDALGRTGA